MIELYVMLIFMIIGAIIAVEVRKLLSAAIALGVVGFALCMVFMMLQAPEVAITQLIVEIIILVILIRATGVKSDNTEILGGRRETLAYVSVIIFVFALLCFGAYALFYMPRFGNPLMTVSNSILQDSVAKTGAINSVSSILFDFRAYDTLGAITVLFVSVWGVISILRPKGRKKIDERDD